MVDIDDYMETFIEEVVDELEDSINEKTDYIHPYNEIHQLDRSIADRVTGRAAGSYTFDREDSAENLRAFIFTDYWNGFWSDFVDRTGMTIMPEYDDIEGFETELRQWLLRYHVWHQAVERVAVSRGASLADVHAMLTARHAVRHI